MSVINCRCGKPLKSGMEVEHSAWLNEFFCSPSCAQDRYFEYMESTPVDFENKLPDGASINDDGFLVDDAKRLRYLTGGGLCAECGSPSWAHGAIGHDFVAPHPQVA